MEKPNIGATMFYVAEHLYYEGNRAAPFLEYCVIAGTVTDFFEGGRCGQMRLIAEESNKGRAPSYFMLNEIGKRVFYERKDAETLAEKLTQKYEATWAWDAPLRRSWK